MALKRKMDFDDAVDVRRDVKQPKLVPFPQTEPDSDVAMMDASDYPLEPLFLSMQQFHTRLPSNASYSSSSAGDSPHLSPMYPSFDLYPSDDQGYIGAQNPFDSPMCNAPRAVGLLQPKNASFTHHGASCTQIPKLRVACSPGLNGQRTMWAHCEQCGAIEMVRTD
ncbi:uncharacterized protein LAESUDRAFT_734442 [Laetiporus sulphureus 93-53]|uniref:Uncharacterized protein n=1 Tax=Laetiporus sulphureus 93-53 TaxID=1314785 RepID=A0A165GNT7_9APHY|nr:uncharacterized protein LAESUDRAFT_734442 [Laetiporus sulphureus 93-53]KZT10602.1 hypothetical protein LAESUDRAFT_734442 [Laetiporus sulphureus 93-53]